MPTRKPNAEQMIYRSGD